MNNLLYLKTSAAPRFRISLLAFLAMTFIGAPAFQETFGQFPQQRRLEIREQRQAEAERRRVQQNEAELAKRDAVPQPRAAVMNVNVQMALTTQEAKTFAEANAKAAKRVRDGETLWMHLKFQGKLGDYVLTFRDEESGTLRYLLYAETGPQDDPTALAKYAIEFSKDDLANPEIRISLTPISPGQRIATPVFLATAATRQPGVWNNELRLTNNPVIPRTPNDNLAKLAFALDLGEGNPRFSGLWNTFRSFGLSGPAADTALPVARSFYSLPIKTAIQQHLNGKSIEPVRFFFAQDHWLEQLQSTTNKNRERSVIAIFTYKNGEECFFGAATATQAYSLMSSKFDDAKIESRDGMPLDCKELQ
ncbi:MAG: hypothetical protein IPM21_03425 [Acidobacteria bacterium]|nr:hypothetical protein [Acidobacteriota bacterium]